MASLNQQLARIEKKLMERAKQVMAKEVADVIKEEMSEAVKEEVYDRYDPTQYERRGSDGGLSDTSNITTAWVGDRLHFRNVTEAHGEMGNATGFIDSIIVSGQGYDWEYSKIYLKPFPRDFYARTVSNLINNQKHVDAFARGMQKFGIKIGRF